MCVLCKQTFKEMFHDKPTQYYKQTKMGNMWKIGNLNHFTYFLN